MAADLPPTRWALEAPPADHPDDLWAIGADLEPGTLVAAYRVGLFPMPFEEVGLAWFSPAERAVIPLERRPPRTLRRERARYEIRFDTSFAEVVEACADPARPHGWIDEQIASAYARLHQLGWAHAVEAWDGEGLAGGLYGVSIGGLFAAESMFHRRPGAAKAALLALVERLGGAGEPDLRLLDVQWPTPHLQLLGAVTVSRATYAERLARALSLPDPFAAPP